MINECEIVSFSPNQLLDKNTLNELYDIEDDTERARIIGICKLRAKELRMEKEFSSVIRAYNEADKKLAEQFRRENNKFNSGINLAYSGKGEPLATIDNFLQILEKDPYFKGIKFNQLTYAPEQVRNGNTERWTDADDARTRYYIEKKYKFHNVQKCDDALRIIFKRNEYHPIRDLIASIKWDGKSRIYNFLNYCTGCEDNEYTREVSRLIFAGGIHRLYDNGCKFDDVPVLIGTKQGEGKSTLVKWLAMNDDYYTEVTEIEGQKGMESVEGAWICELGELLALTKAKEVEAVKSYITRQNDRYRRPFDKRVTDHKRQCIFIGTTNKEQFLTDKTGNRRFYPVKVNQSGYELYDRKEEIQEYIRQCWAEAKVLYDNNELKPYAERSLSDIIRQQQQESVEDDYREGMVAEYLKNKSEICIIELWQRALNNEHTKPTRKESNEIALILQNFDNWEKQDKPKRFGSYGLQKWWKNKEYEWVDDAENALNLTK